MKKIFENGDTVKTNKNYTKYADRDSIKGTIICQETIDKTHGYIVEIGDYTNGHIWIETQYLQLVKSVKLNQQ